MRPIFLAAAATGSLLLAVVTAAEPPSQPPEPGKAKDPVRVAIDACHVAIDREVHRKFSEDETIRHTGDTIYRESIEVRVDGYLELPEVKGGIRYFVYTCRYNERSRQLYGVKLEEQKR